MADEPDDDDDNGLDETPDGAAVFPLIPPELGIHPLLLAVLHAYVFLEGSEEEVLNGNVAEEAMNYLASYLQRLTGPDLKRVKEDFATLVGFAKSLSLEYGKRGLTVAALCPSFVESDMTQRTIRSVMRRHGITEDQARQRIADRCPARRILSAEEIAEVVALITAGQFASAVTLADRGGYPVIGGPPINLEHSE